MAIALKKLTIVCSRMVSLHWSDLSCHVPNQSFIISATPMDFYFLIFFIIPMGRLHHLSIDYRALITETYWCIHTYSSFPTLVVRLNNTILCVLRFYIGDMKDEIFTHRLWTSKVFSHFYSPKHLIFFTTFSNSIFCKNYS